MGHPLFQTVDQKFIEIESSITELFLLTFSIAVGSLSSSEEKHCSGELNNLR